MNLIQRPITLFLAGIGLLVLSCNNKKNSPNSNSDSDPDDFFPDYTNVYKFTDASTPPQYHRSYTISVGPSDVVLVVNSYSDELLRDSSRIFERDYQDFMTKLGKIDIRKTKEKEGEGCTGGTSHRFNIFSTGSGTIKGSVYKCGGKDYGDIEGDVEGAIALFKSMVPGLENKIDKTRKAD